jgi:uncharacterized membrane protein (DUF485 family)
MRKLKKKWTLTIIFLTIAVACLVLSTIMNWLLIPIQDNYISVIGKVFNFVIWLFGFVFGGNIYKKYRESKE